MSPLVWAWLTAAAWATQAVLIRGVVREARPTDVFVVMGMVAGLGAAVVMGARILWGRPLWGMTAGETGLLAGAEVIGVLGLVAFYVALKQTGLARAAAVTEFYPAIAVLIGWAVLGEAPSGLQLTGLFLAGVGVALVQAG